MKRYLASLMALFVSVVISSAQNQIMIAGHGAVDMGLSVKWASCNVGAESEIQNGEFYAWGGTEVKQTYSFDNYKFAKDSILTKYDKQQSRLCGNDDVATQKWGCDWRIPTDKEWMELKDSCKWVWKRNYKKSGVNGFLVVAKNGNSIFLPVVGHLDGNKNIFSKQVGFYWGSTISPTSNEHAFTIMLDKSDVDFYYMCRWEGQTVRAVSEGKKEAVKTDEGM